MARMMRQIAAFVGLLAVGGATGSELSSSLEQLIYLNKGTVSKDDTFVLVDQTSDYWEPENVTRSRYAWADLGTVPMPYTTLAEQCESLGPLVQGTDREGGDYRQVVNTTLEGCQKTCCDEASCQSFVYASASPSSFGSCVEGKPCCFLKAAVPDTKPSPGLTSGTVSRKPLGKDQAPPPGVRSAPPLGGLAAGTMELRGDGTLTAWTTENNSPAGSAKLSKQRAAMFGARVGSGWARVLQTSPLDPEMEGVESLTFGGSPPTTRLQVGGAPAGMEVTLYGYSRMATGNMERSHLPAIAFSMAFKNTGSTAQEVSAFFNLPAMNENTERHGKVLSVDPSATSPEACLSSCNKASQCQSWEFSKAEKKCSLQADSRDYAFEDGTTSGTKALWKQGAGGCLTVNKPGMGPMNGNYSLCGTGGSSLSAGTGTHKDLWAQFAGTGKLSGGVSTDAPHGAMAVSGTVASGDTLVLTITLGYFFPLHNYLDQVLGNQYANFFQDSEGPALELAADLVGTLADIHAIHRPILGSTLPTWMSDSLVATLHHVRSAMWYKDGRWRQWEAYDCVNMDSVHNDGERHIPYIMLFPESTKSKVEAWGRAQASNGMIHEQLACGCQGGIDSGFEHGCGRVMSDCSSMYIIYLLELLRWNNDQDFVRTWYPTARRAAEWQISVSTFHGMPTKLQTTYDVLGMQGYDAVAYSTMFQITCMKAMAELAAFMDLPSDVERYNNAAAAAVEGMETVLWQDDMKAYQAYYEPANGRAIMADTFYAQVLAHSVGLGTLVNETRLGMHLDTEAVTNYDPFGLKILTGRTHGNSETEKDIWMMAPADHAAAMLRIRHGTVEEALEVGGRPYKRLTEDINDVWNACGIMRGNYTTFPGSNFDTAHYGYYMTIWHLMLAMSDQIIDVHAGTFAFSPVTSGPAPAQQQPFSLPVMLPSVLGFVNGSKLQDGSYHVGFCLTAGTVNAKTVSWWGRQYPSSVHLTAGECIDMRL
eukprot:TRINITY_DN64_c1_g1_i1.p1 TRINITY_DN64_c1_g1~~TRINITY_DN64_c1_g1_i1.p1  ORF type:complete len:987 (+),score=326.97 TRINITY_DN64_c1_g1_i1:66-3026(+)